MHRQVAPRACQFNCCRRAHHRGAGGLDRRQVAGLDPRPDIRFGRLCQLHRLVRECHGLLRDVDRKERLRRVGLRGQSREVVVRRRDITLRGRGLATGRTLTTKLDQLRERHGRLRLHDAADAAERAQGSAGSHIFGDALDDRVGIGSRLAQLCVARTPLPSKRRQLGTLSHHQRDRVLEGDVANRIVRTPFRRRTLRCHRFAPRHGARGRGHARRAAARDQCHGDQRAKPSTTQGCVAQKCPARIAAHSSQTPGCP